MTQTIGQITAGEDTAPDGVTTIIETEAAHDTTPLSRWARLWRAVRAGLVQPAATSGAGADARWKGQDAQSGAGGNLVLEAGVKVTTGADGKVLIRQPGAAADIQVYYDGSNAWLQSPGYLILASSAGVSRSFLYTTGGPRAEWGNNVNDYFCLGSGGRFLWNSGGTPNSSGDADLHRVAPKVVAPGDGATTPGPGWLQNTAGRARTAADATNATTTFSSLTDLTVTLAAGRKYTGRLVLRCSDSTAADGIKFDLGGGTATMTNFNAAVVSNIQGATTGVTVSAALATALTLTAMNGTTDHWLMISFSAVVNAGGTLIPRFAQNAHSTGTATVGLGSYLWVEDMP
jgi:hypothetical protein